MKPNKNNTKTSILSSMTPELAKLMDDAQLAIETLESPEAGPGHRKSAASWLESIGRQVSELLRKEGQQ